jgi:hypothetical protein
MEAPERDALMKAYELAHADHRAEVSLGWERQKFFLSLNPAILITAGGIAARFHLAAVAALGVGTVLSIVGALTVARSHGRTRRTRDTLDACAHRVGVEGPEVTGGQRALHGKPRKERFRVVTLMIIALAINALLDAGLAVYLGWTYDEAPSAQSRPLD